MVGNSEILTFFPRFACCHFLPLHPLDNISDDVDGILFLADSVVIAASSDLIAYGLENQIPVVGIATHAEDGAFMGFGPKLDAIGAQTARLARQIMEGTPAQDIPVETAEYFMTLNIATADAIGIELTNAQLELADSVVRAND
jgi:putative ABC transport system substrate-binding protein